MKDRVYYLDALRSFAILMVLALHSISGYITQPALYGTASWYFYLVVNALARTGVPLFFMLSGFLLLSSAATKDFGRFYKKSLLRIGLPLAVWNVVYFVWQCLRGVREPSAAALLGDVLDTGTSYHLWYLYALAGVYLVAPFLRMLVEACTERQLGWLLLLMLFCGTLRPFLNLVTPLYVNLFDPLFNGYLGFFLLGYLLGTLRYGRRTLLCAGALGLLGAAFSVVYHHVHSSPDGIRLALNGGFSLCHTLLAAAVFLAARAAFETRGPLRGPVTFLSAHSFGVYLVHVLVLEAVFDWLMIDASPAVSSLYLFAASLAGSLLLSFLYSLLRRWAGGLPGQGGYRRGKRKSYSQTKTKSAGGTCR